MKFLLYGNGDFANKGCEAIAQGMCHLLGTIHGAEVLLGSYFPEQDRMKAAEIGAEFVKINRNREGLSNVLGATALKLGFIGAGLQFQYSGLKAVSRDVNAAVSIGGDNYCYPGRERYYRMHRTLKAAGKKTVFAACSIEEKDIDNRMLDDLRRFDAILPRETYTYQTLQSKGLNNLYLCSDPAFVMPPMQTSFMDSMDGRQYIGINISPLTFSYSDGADKSWASIIQMIRSLLSNTDYRLLLIPHVYGDGNDPDICKKIKREFPSEERVEVLTGEYSAPQLKGIISACKALICARTHASIAGYSSLVPTYVLGYSCKSSGIAMDLFGTTKGYVFPVKHLNKEADDLECEIGEFCSHIDEIKRHLECVIPPYIEKCAVIRDVLERKV